MVRLRIQPLNLRFKSRVSYIEINEFQTEVWAAS